MCLSFADLNSTASLGPVLAVGVAVTLLVMVTLLPALLVIFGRWIFWPVRPSFGSAEPTQTGLWARVGDRIKVRPRQVWVGTAVLLAIACLGLFKLDANGLSTEDSFTETLDSVTAQKLLADHDLADNSNTIQVVANDDQLAEVEEAIAGIDGLGTATDPTSIGGGRSYFEVPIKFDLASQAAFDIVEAARDKVHAVDGADALVGGGAAFYLDTKTASQRDNKVVIPLVLLVVLVILVLLLRALTAPLILIGTVILSFGAALGLSSLVFHYVFDFAGADPGFPLFAFVFLVALGVDYNIFLMTRVREETAQHGTRRGLADRAVLDRRRDHLGRPGPRRDVPGAGDAAVRVPGRARVRRGAGRAAGHDDRPVGAGHRAQPRPRRQDLVAEQARHRAGRGRPGRGRAGAGVGLGLKLTAAWAGNSSRPTRR